MMCGPRLSDSFQRAGKLGNNDMKKVNRAMSEDNASIPYLVVGCKSWHRRFFDEVISRFAGQWSFIGNNIASRRGFAKAGCVHGYDLTRDGNLVAVYPFRARSQECRN